MSWERLRRSTWTIPGVFAGSCIAALIVALAEDGIWDVLSILVLTVPLVTIGTAVLIRGRN